MKKTIPFLLLFVLLTSCQIIDNSSSSSRYDSSFGTPSDSSHASTPDSSLTSQIPNSSSTSQIPNSSSSTNSSSTQMTGKQELTIVAINDFHGAVEQTDKYPGLTALGAKIRSIQAQNPDGTIVLSAGDSFQGSALSNLTHGKVVVDAMNALSFEAMAIGNHEFDWGAEVIAKHHNGIEEDGEANFPYLACNIYENQGTLTQMDDSRVSWADDYTIVERKGIRIGIVGWIGEGLESSIAVSRVQDYTFHSPMETMRPIIRSLRKEEGCQLIIAVGHDASTSVNTSLASLTGEERVDYIINGHSHSGYIEQKGSIYVSQAYSNGMAVSEAKISYNIDTETVETYSCPRLYYQSEFRTMDDAEIGQMVQEVQSEFGTLINTPIVKSAISIDKDLALRWVSNVTKAAADVDFGVGNKAGVRGTFPIAAGTDMTVNIIYSLMPFDNNIKIGTVTGSNLKRIATNTSLVMDAGYDASKIVDTKTYQIAANSYVFDGYDLFQNYVTNAIDTGYGVRTALLDDLYCWKDANRAWNPSQGVLVERVW